MHLTVFMRIGKVVLVALAFMCPVIAQNVRVEMAKHATAIPKVCQAVVPVSLEGPIDVPALVKEAICKGAGDMMGEYTYVLDSRRRDKDKKGQVKETSTTYEVFIPTLKSGTRARGVLVTTSRNGVPVTPEELEKERREAGSRIEKEEERIARETPSPEKNSNSAESNPNEAVAGMRPLGMYARIGISRSAFGISRGSERLAVITFLTSCDLLFLRREPKDGRETLVFKFTPRPSAQFNEDERYLAQLNGEIWIDAQDRIVTRVAGWPAAEVSGVGAASSETAPPAIYLEMLRLPTGVWLPHVARINGVDYPKLFSLVKWDSISTYSNYIHFSTEVKDVNVGPGEKPNN
jgi:hypothetical protein